MRARSARAFVACLATALVASAAHAGAPGTSPRQLRIPWTFAPEVDGFEGTLVHGAGLAFLDGAEMGVGWSHRVEGDGAANGFLAGAAGRLGFLGLGMAVSRIGEDGLDDAVTRLDVTEAIRFGDWGAIGVQWHKLFGGGDLDGFGSVSLSSTIRPARAVALSLAVDRVNRPRMGGEELDRVVRGGIGLRPGTERVTFGAEGAAILTDEVGWLTGVSLRFMPIAGLEIGGYGRFVREMDRADRMEWGAYLGLGQGGAHLGSSVDRRTRASDDPVASTTDVSMLLKMGTRDRPSLVPRRGRVVELRLSGGIPERPPAGILGDSSPPMGAWLAALDAMSRDPDISGLLLDIREAPGWAQSWELRRAITRLQERGKRVYARLTTGGMREMYLASAADRVLLHSSGVLNLLGLSVTRLYLARLLSNLGVRAEIVRWDAYKSAPERLTRQGPSDEAREQSRRILEAFQAAWFRAVGDGRGLDREQLEAILAEGPQTMHMAHREGLVDRVVSDRKIEEAIREDLGEGARVVKGYTPSPKAWRRWGGPQRIAVVPVVGSIVDGEGSDLDLPLIGRSTGDRDVTEALERAARDPAVVGIVVRVNSPGGSVTASERMYQAVVEAAERKPLVVSFGDTAASGGYYLSCAAPRILSAPVTVTGSIGIFAGKVDLSGLYDLLGIDTETWKTTPHADAMGTHRPWTDEERQRARARLETYYDRFVTLVAAGRGLSKEEAYERAGGRVYTGGHAVSAGLVDAEGGLWDAIVHVRREAGLGAEVPVDVAYMVERGLLARIGDLVARGFGGLRGEGRIPWAEGPAGTLARWAAALTHLSKGGIQARPPYSLEIR